MKDLNWNKMKGYLLQPVLLLVIGGLVWFGVGFLRDKIQMMKDRIQEVNVLSDYQNRQLARMPELQQQYDYIESNLDEFNIILAKDDFVSFIRTLEDLADKNGVAIKNTSRDNTVLESKSTSVSNLKAEKTVAAVTTDPGDAPVPQKKAPKLTGILAELPLQTYIRLNISVTGEYPKVVEFVRQVETLPIALDVVSLSMKEAEGPDGTVVNPPAGVNPFQPSGSTPTPAPAPEKKQLVEATFDTVVYLDKQ